MKNIAVIGTGYVGLVQGIVLSEFGFNVYCVDIDVDRIEKLKIGIMPIYEPGLDELLKKNQLKNRLHFLTDFRYAIENCEIIFIAVGTPSSNDGSTDLTFVKNVANKIALYMNNYKVIVNKSTVPVGTGKFIKELIQLGLEEHNMQIEFDVVSNPEFLREGNAINDCLMPSRIVLGSDSTKAMKIMKDIYISLCNKTRFVETNIETAEMIKYASNAFLAVKISYINELALLSEKVGADIKIIAEAMGIDDRISPYFLNAGPGYGGSCFPKDTTSIVKVALEYGERLLLVEACIEANNKQKARSANKIINGISQTKNIKVAKVGIWGLSFKPETDDVRESPSLYIIQHLVSNGAKIKAFCPKGIVEAKHVLSQISHSIEYCNNEYDAANDVDALVILTEWDQFCMVDLKEIKSRMSGSLFFDLRNIFNRNDIEDIGFKYFGTGR